MLAPQSDEEVRPVVEALRRRLDPLLDIRWEAKAVMTKRGHYSAIGESRLPEYDGRWEIIRYDPSASLHDDRIHNGQPYVRIIRITELASGGIANKYPVMVADGAYAPVGMYLVAYMAVWDRAQQHFIKAMDALWEEHEAVDRLNHADSQAAHQEALHKVYREHGGEYWTGGAQGKASPEAERALWPAVLSSP